MAMKIAPGLKQRLPLIYAGVWVMIAIAHMLVLFAFYHVPWICAATEAVFFNLSFALIGVGLWYMLRFSDLNEKTWPELLFIHLTVITAVQLIWILPVYGLLKLIFRDVPEYLLFLSDTIAIRVITGVIMYTVVVSLAYLIVNQKKLRNQQLKQAELQTLLKETELSMLRFQINPHFLFNSLNSVNALILVNPVKAQEMVVNLSDFMRYSLESGSKPFSTLERELEHCRLYFRIEKVRFGERLRVVEQIHPDLVDRPVPAMILQPLAENAVKHGLSDLEEGAEILIRCEPGDGEMVVISVKNPFDSSISGRKPGTGTGLKNIRERFRNLYNRDDLITIIKDRNAYSITLKIPTA